MTTEIGITGGGAEAEAGVRAGAEDGTETGITAAEALALAEALAVVVVVLLLVTISAVASIGTLSSSRLLFLFWYDLFILISWSF